MPFTKGLYILRRVVEDDPKWHRVYKQSENSNGITSADNYFSSAPALAAKSEFDVERVDTNAAWNVTLAANGSAQMAVFKLK